MKDKQGRNQHDKFFMFADRLIVGHVIISLDQMLRRLLRLTHAAGRCLSALARSRPRDRGGLICLRI